MCGKNGFKAAAIVRKVGRSVKGNLTGKMAFPSRFLLTRATRDGDRKFRYFFHK
jgi:hypothetical protein